MMYPTENREKQNAETLTMQEIQEAEATIYKYTKDGSVDAQGRPAHSSATGRWFAGIILLMNQGLATLAFYGVGVNLVLFLTRILHEDTAEAANSVSKWTGTVYICSLIGAFLSDAYWGRYKACTIFQVIYVVGIALLSLVTHKFLIDLKGCGTDELSCGEHSEWELGLFYLAIYMIALGNGGYQPNVATFGADQFDNEDPRQGESKNSFFSYFYLALNLGELVSNTVLGYFENEGMWVIGFWLSTASAFVALVLFVAGTSRYRYFKPKGNPWSRFCQVIIAAVRKWSAPMPENDEDLYEVDARGKSRKVSRKILHTHGFKFLDRAACISSKDDARLKKGLVSPWQLCPVNQVEEVKCVLRLLPVWLCTIIYSVVFTQSVSIFVEQGEAMRTDLGEFKIPPAGMSGFEIITVAVVIFLYRRIIDPILTRIRKSENGLTQLQRMGIGLVIAILAMLAAGIVECYRLEYRTSSCHHCKGSSSLHILWQIPQYALIGASEVFMYVPQLEFFNAQSPDRLKSFGSALCMTSISLGNYVSSILVTIIMKISTDDNMAGWIPSNLNKGHLDRFYFLLAGLTALDLILYIFIARWYEYIKMEARDTEYVAEKGENAA